jgi:hypothetical protein
MTDTDLKHLKEMLVAQYAQLNNLSDAKMLEKLAGTDFRIEFNNLRKQSRMYKILLIVGSTLSLAVLLFRLLLIKEAVHQHSMDVLGAIFTIAIIVIIFQRILSKISLKIRLLGFLYEFYKR